jgi:hypothetical protein
MKIQAKKVQTITVIDPDTKFPVNVIIAKLDNGAMVGIDESYLANTEEPVYTPYQKAKQINVDEL